MRRETAEVALREFVRADAPELARLCAEWDVARMTSRMPHPYALSDAEAFLDMLGESDAERAFAITGDGVLMGAAGWMLKGEGAFDVGYWLGRPFWGGGVATRAGAAMLERAFAETTADQARACVFQDNPASARVLEKLGFRNLGPCIGPSRARGGEAPTWNYALDRADWEARR